MGLDNNLNVSELLRRLGVKGDSLGSAPLLEALRLTLNIGDLSNLVPPVGTPFGAAALPEASGVGTVNKWNLECRAPGGLKVQSLEGTTGNFAMWITPTNLFGAVLQFSTQSYSFQQPVRSVFNVYADAGAVAPASAFQFGGALPSTLQGRFDNWVGPGEFFNIEATGQNSVQTMRISWKEYPAAISP